MEIIVNNYLSKKLKDISEYSIDLGLAVKIDDSGKKGDYASSGKWKIKDMTIFNYYEIFGSYISRIGKIGTLLFYLDLNIKNNNIYIIHENNIYVSEYDNSPIRFFLSNLIKDVIDNKLNSYVKINNKKEKTVNLKNMTNEELSDYLSKNR